MELFFWTRNNKTDNMYSHIDWECIYQGTTLISSKYTILFNAFLFKNEITKKIQKKAKPKNFTETIVSKLKAFLNDQVENKQKKPSTQTHKHALLSYFTIWFRKKVTGNVYCKIEVTRLTKQICHLRHIRCVRHITSNLHQTLYMFLFILR